MSRLVFATPRVRNLLGLRNLEIRDLDKSSLDAVLLGRPHLLFLPGGVIQIQSLYEGSRGPGAARLLGVTAFLNGRAGLGPDIESAVRQALNEPAADRRRASHGPDRRREAGRARLPRRERAAGGRDDHVRGRQPRAKRLKIATGRGTVSGCRRRPATLRVRVEVTGLDGTAGRTARRSAC